MSEAVIVAAVRTAIGTSFKGTLANTPALITSLIRPGRTQDALVYVLETDEPSDLLELITPFMGLVQWDISPALELDVALAATVQAADKATPP